MLELGLLSWKEMHMCSTVKKKKIIKKLCQFRYFPFFPAFLLPNSLSTECYWKSTFLTSITAPLGISASHRAVPCVPTHSKSILLGHGCKDAEMDCWNKGSKNARETSHPHPTFKGSIIPAEQDHATRPKSSEAPAEPPGDVFGYPVMGNWN